MSIRRTRQQKMHSAVRREESAIHYEPAEKVVAKSQSSASHTTLPEQKYFLMDLQKTALSTVVIIILLAFAFYVLR
jgi:hypothetical protein